jgi:hypothetical protein
MMAFTEPKKADWSSSDSVQDPHMRTQALIIEPLIEKPDRKIAPDEPRDRRMHVGRIPEDDLGHHSLQHGFLARSSAGPDRQHHHAEHDGDEGDRFDVQHEPATWPTLRPHHVSISARPLTGPIQRL